MGYLNENKNIISLLLSILMVIMVIFALVDMKGALDSYKIEIAELEENNVLILEELLTLRDRDDALLANDNEIADYINRNLVTKKSLMETLQKMFGSSQ